MRTNIRRKIATLTRLSVVSRAFVGAAVLLMSFQNCGPQNLSVAATSDSKFAVRDATSGPDFSGTWRFTRVDCYDPTMQTVVNAGSASGLTDVMVITADALTETISQGACNVQQAASLSFTASLFTLSSESVVNAADNATDNSCEITTTLSNASILPTVSTTTYSTSENVLPAIRSAYYLYDPNLNPPELSLLSNFADVNRNYCFNVFQKQ